MLTDDIWCADVNFLGAPGAIAAGVVEGPGGLALVDPGPTTCLPGLAAALAARRRRLADVGAVLVTHVHLDHSGAAGTLIREIPSARVYVHQAGAAHIVDPTRLIASARRIFGDRMDRLWGDIEPVPESRVRVLIGGETLDVVGRSIRVAYTPGHAVHHVSYFDEAGSVAFTGDVGGMVLAGTAVALPPTPPPDIDVEQWQESLSRIRAWHPRALVVAHFGVVEPAARHLGELEGRLLAWADRVRELVGDDSMEEAARLESFRETVRSDLRRSLARAKAAEVERAFMLDDSWHGLARYWRKRWERECAR